jgi:hypothetical protein
MDTDNEFVIPAQAGIQVLSNRRGRIEKAVLHELNGLKYALSRAGAIDKKSVKGEQP